MSASAFSAWLGVQRCPAQVLERMYVAGAVTRPPGRRGQAVRQSVRRLRAAMDAEAIDTTSDGYVLLPAGREECERALRECAG